MPAVTVVVPTLNEAGNLEPLVTRLAAAFGPRADWEVLLVDDDSKDDTPAVAERLARSHPVRLVVRKGERGLATAVMKGIAESASPVVVVMDADLSHPPEVAPRLAAAVEGGADLAIGSRYVEGGGTEGWSKVRLLMSRTATLLARGLTSASDPMAGYFCLRRSLLDGVAMRVRGFKILLEILARARPAKVVEIPIHFGNRLAGESKLGAGVTVDYLRQLAQLYAARPAVQVLAMIFAVTGLRGVASALLEPTSIEAYHWLYGKHPAAGYYDHPGMIGWLSWLSTSLFGDSPLGLRMLTLLGGGLGAWWIFLAGRRWAGEREGRLAAMLFLLLPMTFAFGAAATPDAPVLLFSAGTIWALAHAVKGGRGAWWLLAGLALGLALDSKYHAAFLGVGAFAWLAATVEGRRHLATPWPWLGALAALAAFSPTLAWNAQNGWQSLAYQGVERFREAKGFRPMEPVDFWKDQLLLGTPVVALLMWGAGLKALWKRDHPDRLLAALCVPLLVFFFGLAFFRSVRGHWTAPAYAAGVLLVACSALRSTWGRRLVVGTVGILGIGYLVAVPVIVSKAPPGWLTLASWVDSGKPSFVLARDYHDAAQLAYHLRPLPVCDFTAVGNPAKSFRNWWDGRALAGKDAIVVYEKKDWPSRSELLKACFAQLDDPIEVRVPRFGGREEVYLLVRARKYQPIPSTR